MRAALVILLPSVLRACRTGKASRSQQAFRNVSVARRVVSIALSLLAAFQSGFFLFGFRGELHPTLTAAAEAVGIGGVSGFCFVASLGFCPFFSPSSCGAYAAGPGTWTCCCLRLVRGPLAEMSLGS